MILASWHARILGTCRHEACTRHVSISFSARKSRRSKIHTDATTESAAEEERNGKRRGRGPNLDSPVGWPHRSSYASWFAALFFRRMMEQAALVYYIFFLQVRIALGSNIQVIHAQDKFHCSESLSKARHTVRLECSRDVLKSWPPGIGLFPFVKNGFYSGAKNSPPWRGEWVRINDYCGLASLPVGLQANNSKRLDLFRPAPGLVIIESVETRPGYWGWIAKEVENSKYSTSRWLQHPCDARRISHNIHFLPGACFVYCLVYQHRSAARVYWGGGSAAWASMPARELHAGGEASMSDSIVRACADGGGCYTIHVSELSRSTTLVFNERFCPAISSKIDSHAPYHSPSCPGHVSRMIQDYAYEEALDHYKSLRTFAACDFARVQPERWWSWWCRTRWRRWLQEILVKK